MQVRIVVTRLILRRVLLFLSHMGKLALGVEHGIAVEIVGEVCQRGFKTTSSLTDAAVAIPTELSDAPEGVFDTGTDTAFLLVVAFLLAIEWAHERAFSQMFACIPKRSSSAAMIGPTYALSAHSTVSRPLSLSKDSTGRESCTAACVTVKVSMSLEAASILMWVL